MAFGKKKAAQEFDPSKVTYLATEALKKSHQMRAQLAIRATLETPMLMHQWSSKAFLQMLGSMVGLPVDKGLLDLTENYENSYYRNVDGDLVVPCRIIKAAIVSGATGQNVVTKAELKRMLRVLGWTSPVKLPKGKDVTMQIDIGRTSSGTPLPISRALVPEGATFDFVLDFPCVLHPDKVMVALTAGFSTIGIGDWRPDKGGDYGTASIDVLPETQVPKVIDSCRPREDQFKIPPEFLRSFTANMGKMSAENIAKADALSKKATGLPLGDLVQRSADESPPRKRNGARSANGVPA